MRLTRLQVTNHRAIPDVDVEVRDHLVLVGPNESGKTSLLRLLDATLGGSAAALYGLIEPGVIRDPAQPLILRVEFGHFTDEDKAALPDQIEVLPDGSLRLTVDLRATLSPDGGEATIERVFAKKGLVTAIAAAHLPAFGWTFLPANRSPDRELGAGRSGAVRNLLDAVDLESSLDAVIAAVSDLHAAVHGAASLTMLRRNLGEALTELLPRTVSTDDLVFELPNSGAENPLADVEVKLREAAGTRPLREQSDGFRAMSTVAVQLMVRADRQIVAVDEPEVHLHPRAQARTGSMLRSKAGQAVVATHSPAVLSQFSPMHVLAFVQGSCRQLHVDPFGDDAKAADHWWTTPTLEPLTCRGLILVEGVSDRTLVEAVARTAGHDLDRLGIVVASVNGAGGFKMALRLFGRNGFDVPLVGLVDDKEADDVAHYLGIQRSGLDQCGFVICSPDLEAECISRLGAGDHAALLVASGLFKTAALCSANGVASLGELDPDGYAAWCRKHKTEVATALAISLTLADAQRISPLSGIVSRAVALAP